MEKRNQRNLLLALVILLVTLGIALAKNHDFWFGSDETQEAENAAPISNPAAAAKTASKTAAPAANTPAPAQNSAPARNHSVAAARKTEVARQSAAEVVPQPAVIEAPAAEIPPLEVEVVAGDSHRALPPGSNSVLVVMPPKSGFRTNAAAFKWSPVTNVSERTRISSGQKQFEEASYPVLAKQMKVQGSVLLQASVGADGDIKDLRVLRGNPILSSAAKEAARQWRFRPSVLNGQAVETKQEITVNFTIHVL